MAPRRSFSKRFMPAPKNVAAFLVAVLAMLACVVSDIARRAPTPRRGKAIGVVDYKVDAAWLRDRGDAASAKLATTFVQSKRDVTLEAFLAESRRAGATRVGRIALYAVDHYLFWALQRYLGWSRPDASGFLRKASLYVASEAQFARIAGAGAPALLDVGSGTGTETAKLARALGASRVVAVETSAPMRRQLGAASAAAAIPAGPFGAAALLNVLDRCDDPGGLLDAAAAAAPGGLLLVATAWTRLPYVSSGDSKKSHYTLDVALMAFRVGTAFEAVLAAGGRRRRARRAPAPLDDAPPAACEGKGGDKIFNWLAKRARRRRPLRHARSRGATPRRRALSSTCWLARTPFATLTAVTARAAGTDAYGDRLRDAFAGAKVDVVVGNWREAGFLAGKRYDVVVADYLLGAVELHWPHGADAVLARLLGALKPGGTLLFVGVEPYESLLDRADDADRLVLDVESLGDSAAALAGEATYRELPEAWITRQVTYARTTSAKIADAGLQKAYERRVAELTIEVNAWKGTHRKGRNYALVVKRS
ncbi:hypothetical protein JL722_1849 [Aureococcus anophagefferens]|nr:hypothetical protein JL722_1849 [Aureococcus anophagefferens]